MAWSTWGNYQPTVAPGSLVGIFGSNLASQATASTTGMLPAILGGTCVTVNNADALMATTSGQINAQIPPNLAAGKYPVVIHSIANQAVLFPATVTGQICAGSRFHCRCPLSITRTVRR